MKGKRISTLIMCLMLVWYFLPAPAQAAGPDSTLPVVFNLNPVLQPGVWHGWGLGPSSADRGYIVEVTPLEAPRGGNHVERALVQPEFDGQAWNDVLRVMLPEGMEPLKVNLRVYETSRLPVATEFPAVLTPGDWMGWVIGPASTDRGYVVEVTPLEPAVDGAYVEKALIQQEYFMGEWQDVLRAQIPAGQPALPVHFRIYATGRLPIISEFEADLDPGGWNGFILNPSTAKGGYIVETTPLFPVQVGEYVEKVAVQPEFDGSQWNDVLRLQAVNDQPWIRVQVRVYGLKKIK